MIKQINPQTLHQACVCQNGKCPTCNGTGIRFCTVEVGHLEGQCPLCHDTGMRVCEWCHGNGRHVLCNGTGMLSVYQPGPLAASE